MSINIIEGAHVRVVLVPDCDGGDRCHVSVEDGMRGQITSQRVSDHPYFVLFQGRSRASRLPGDPFAMLPLGRWYRSEELEQIADSA